MQGFKNFLLHEQIKKIDIDYLLPHKDDMETAVDSLSKGRPSFDTKPITVYPVGNNYVVADGHHRLLQAILDGDTEIKANILEQDPRITSAGTIELDSSNGRFYGLDDLLDNGWLINRL